MDQKKNDLLQVLQQGVTESELMTYMQSINKWFWQIKVFSWEESFHSQPSFVAESIIENRPLWFLPLDLKDMGMEGLHVSENKNWKVDIRSLSPEALKRTTTSKWLTLHDMSSRESSTILCVLAEHEINNLKTVSTIESNLLCLNKRFIDRYGSSITEDDIHEMATTYWLPLTLDWFKKYCKFKISQRRPSRIWDR